MHHTRKDITLSSVEDFELHRQRDPCLELTTWFLHIWGWTQMNRLEYRNSGFLMWFYACFKWVAEEKSIYTINLKSFNYLKSTGRLIFTENRHLTLILQRHANDSQVAKSFWIAYYSILRCWRSKGRLQSLIRKTLCLSVGRNSMLTQPLELRALWVSAHRKGKTASPSLETDSCCKMTQVNFLLLIKPVSLLAMGDDQV